MPKKWWEICVKPTCPCHVRMSQGTTAINWTAPWVPGYRCRMRFVWASEAEIHDREVEECRNDGRFFGLLKKNSCFFCYPRYIWLCFFFCNLVFCSLWIFMDLSWWLLWTMSFGFFGILLDMFPRSLGKDERFPDGSQEDTSCPDSPKLTKCLESNVLESWESHGEKIKLFVVYYIHIF